MKKIFARALLLISILLISGCTNEIEEGYNNVDLLAYTSQFNGNSDTFSFDIGKVNFTDNEKGILIKGFKQKKKIDNLLKIKFIISFDNKIWSSQETNPNQKVNKVDSIIKNIVFYERGQICGVDGGIACEETSFNQTNKDDFKDKIKVEVEYCTKNGKCKFEQFKISYIEE